MAAAIESREVSKSYSSRGQSLHLAPEEMGRAFQLSGDKASAATAYAEVEKIWRDSDPSFPPLRKLHAYQHELGIARMN